MHKLLLAFKNRLSKHPQDRRQLVEVLHDARKQHLLDEDALSMMEGVLQVSSRQVRDTMVPRTRMVVIKEDAHLDEIIKTISDSRHSRFPVTNEDQTEIIGLLLAKDLLPVIHDKHRKQFDLKTMLHPLKMVPESMRLDRLLKDFRLAHSHLAIVIDEYSAITGLVTIEDVVEQIVGEIEDEGYDEQSKEDITEIAPGRFHILGTCSISDFNQYFESHLNGGMLTTVGGLIAKRFGYFPSAGEQLTINRLAFTIVQSDQRHIRLIEVNQHHHQTSQHDVTMA